ncbi:UPF0481 protein At3g47200-like [Macadamia integrifolia]|uniref:UPF0481 protein At3g47200-like n=1 Tax=Macadamia integrifolia TaxID=60698 RepID=UPI001C52D0C7|nr:UPF0481 protein At3g47200-like [Macadamia integrifolia]
MASSNERPFVSFERSVKKKVVIEGFHEAGRGSTEPDIIVNERERSVVITETSVTCPQWLLPTLCEPETPQPGTKAIDKVPTILRDIEKHKGCFDPLMVSIGPYHHGNLKFARAEKVKASLAAKKFTEGKFEKLVNFEEVSRNAKECYEKSSTASFSDDKFTLMMFQDGCFVLHFIDCIVNGRPSDTMMKTDQIVFVSTDLFLLENQLPFPVLESLMSSFKPSKGEWGDLISEFVTNQLKLNKTSSREKALNPQSTKSPQKFDKPAHLLDILHKKLIGEEEKPESSGKKKKPIDDDDLHSFRSVVELKKAGIKCKKSKSGSLRDVKFEDYCIRGQLFLPHLVIDDLTKSSLLNLVAYEVSPDGPSDYAVTSYIVLLDSLIDHSEDVKELRSEGILKNLLGSDQQVADLFNELAIHLMPSPSEYLIVKGNIEKFYRKKFPIWMAELWHTYFSSPWKTIAFFIAGSIILLTFAQTYFSIFPREGGGGEGERKAPTASRKIHYI